jgi:hypothetical protein
MSWQQFMYSANRMANAEMTKKQAYSWACTEAGLGTGAWSQNMAGTSSLMKRVSQAMGVAKNALQNIS